MKIKTFRDIRENLLEIDHFKEQFEFGKDCFCSGFGTARFIYNPKDKTIYDYIGLHDYRSGTHSDIIEHFGFIKVEVHRLEFNQEKCYDGSYLYKEFGISGLKYSSICSQKMIDLLPKPSKQELDYIEKYIDSLKSELYNKEIG